jgi:uncharacterized protein YbjT (DUF2867 family)
MILVTGAAGKTGLAVITVLGDETSQIRALVHREKQAELVLAAGASEVLVGDIQEQAVVSEAMSGIRKVYHICPNVSPQELTIGQTVLEAAQKNNISQFVYHSVLHPQVESMPHHWLKMRVEEAIFESGLPFTILQPAPYMQNILVNWDEIVRRGIYSIPYGPDTRLSLVDLKDVAQVAAVVLTKPGHKGAIYELCGPDALNQNEMAEIVSDQLGDKIAVQSVDHLEWERQARECGLGKYQVKTLLQMFDYYDRFGLVGNPRALSWLLGYQSTPFSEFVGNVIRSRS